MDVGAADPLRVSLGRHEEQVRLDDVVVGEHDVQRGEEDLAEAVRLHVAGSPDRDGGGPGRADGWSGGPGREVLAVDQLVPLAVLGHREEVGIGEPGGSRRHGTLF